MMFADATKQGGMCKNKAAIQRYHSWGNNGLTKIPQNPARTKVQSVGRVYPLYSAPVRPWLVTASSFETSNQDKHQQSRAGSGNTTNTVGLKHSPCTVRLWGQGWFNPRDSFGVPNSPLVPTRRVLRGWGQDFHSSAW